MGMLGRVLFAFGGAGLGLLSLVHADFVLVLIPAPEALPSRALLAYAADAVLIGASLGLLVPRIAKLSAIALAAFWFIAIMLTQIPVVLAATDAGPWTGACEALCMFAGALIAHGRFAFVGRLLFAATLPVFGYLHFAFLGFVASVIPAWLTFGPLTATLWAQITGAAHIAAGLSLLSGVLAWLGATLLGFMFAGFVVLLHIPRVVADTGNRMEWNSMLIAVSLAGVSWLIAAGLPRKLLAPPLGARPWNPAIIDPNAVSLYSRATHPRGRK